MAKFCKNILLLVILHFFLLSRPVMQIHTLRRHFIYLRLTNNVAIKILALIAVNLNQKRPVNLNAKVQSAYTKNTKKKNWYCKKYKR